MALRPTQQAIGAVGPPTLGLGVSSNPTGMLFISVMTKLSL